jgi:hypothetical protein
MATRYFKSKDGHSVCSTSSGNRSKAIPGLPTLSYNWIEIDVKEFRKLKNKFLTHPSPYRNIECPNCKRYRVQTNGVCEKCFWDFDGNDYASVTRPQEYDHLGPIVKLSENDPFERKVNHE